VLKLWEFAVLLVVALLTAIVVLFNMRQFGANRELQFEVSQRAQFVQQTIPLENLSREIALALAQLGVRSQDDQIRALLNSLGISVTVNQAPAPATVPPPAPAKGPAK
jgi:hypothetical protein